MNQTHYL